MGFKMPDIGKMTGIQTGQQGIGMLAAIGGLATKNEGLAEAGLNLYGADRQNMLNQQMTREQMDFQERMSSTAHTRQVQDLKNAGLNPLLSSMSSGASSPGGANMQAQNIMTGAIASAQEAKRIGLAAEKQSEEIKNMKATRRNTDMDTAVKAKELPKSEAYNYFWDKAKSAMKDVNSFSEKIIKPLYEPKQTEKFYKELKPTKHYHQKALKMPKKD